MTQPGKVSLGHLGGFGETADWQFHVLSPNGTYDLVAIEIEPSRFAIRRDQVIDRDMTLAAVDLDQEGAALVEFPLSVTNLLAYEGIGATAQLTTGTDTTAWIPYRQQPMLVILDTALRATDTQTVEVWGAIYNLAPGGRPAGPSYSRSTRRPISSGDSGAFTLPTPLDKLHFSIADGALTATWTALPPHDTLQIRAYSLLAGGSVVTHVADLSAGYIDVTGITSMTFDIDIPNFAHQWNLDFSAQYELIATTLKDGVEATTSEVFEAGNVPAMIAPNGRVFHARDAHGLSRAANTR